ncbi:formimidoylglutamate deiminase [Stappia taiwanensis]|uniref:Formimidoylglutamate deiminase n=1 Tax=Stappia taiwanensis TaxID=992267 RepID=A0A838XQT3_9HYPH|nr:formimidoylglutamate deiminase [Stappia taiwanensis]MBA4612632.1 formimidoylglutamate deiminase [Stappia taiwanensis]GGE88890.1 formimidoylglutamate deiminase [Stappia taiwanensis]
MTRLWAETALLADGWHRNVAVEITANGRIAAVETGVSEADCQADQRLGILLPAPSNLHSHAFQRAMAGLSERRGEGENDSFWTWRELMYRFLASYTPERVEAVAAFVQMEMLEAGYAASAEFHYLHNQPDGAAYADPAELSRRIVAAAGTSGIGLTLLPVYYATGGIDGRPLAGGQLRFRNDLDSFARLIEGASSAVASLGPDARLGLAPHSLRAVPRDALTHLVALRPDDPLHMHIAEQTAEIAEVEAGYGARPVRWLLDAHDVDGRWCLIHCTHLDTGERRDLAASGAVAGLCPITESSLGDGIFDGARYLADGGVIGIGSDSNIRISLSEELRTLEYSQRLRDRQRAVLATRDLSCGRRLYDAVTAGGAQALGRDCGAIATGRLADLVALDAGSVHLDGCAGDELLDAWIFAGDDRLVRDVWAAGRHVVREGRHVRRAEIEKGYRDAVRSLRQGL